MRSSFLVLVFAFVVGSAIAQTTVTKAFGDVKILDISTTGGTIVLGRSGTQMVQVYINYNLDKKKYQPLIEKKDSVLYLKEEYRYKPSPTARSTWQINIPDGLRVQYSSNEGDLDINSLTVAVVANSLSGNYHWNNVNGNSTVTTQDGDIKIEKYQGDLDIKGRAGDVGIAKSVGALSINTNQGDILLTEVTGGFSVATGNGSIRAQRIHITQESTLSSVSGETELWLGAPVKADLTVKTNTSPVILHCNSMKLDGTLVLTANKNSRGVHSSFPLGTSEEIKDESNGTLRVRNTLRLGSSGNVVSVSTETGGIAVRK
jgi:hypothetical protein